ncbi:MAG: hypothetical protein COT73_13000 [Bdellovibrio sp. CG10_big_fil_rev_8_21_14_0_10_47_8]|nr:MAG: hypothetical protein COT73_13000 [Bdellovibrio sp. CG10_big_fil_rev_8_21_14_0_10_47_8]
MGALKFCICPSVLSLKNCREAFSKSFPRSSWLALFALLLIKSVGYASPMPATGSSALVAPQNGLFLAIRGFELKTEKTNWIFATPKTVKFQNQDSDNKEPWTDLELRMIKPDVATASFFVKTDVLKADLSLENYAKRWMKDYPQYGFEILGTRAFSQNSTRGLLIDLFHRKSNEQVRQVLFLKDRQAVIMTCKDTKTSFNKTLSDCNQVVKSFAWTAAEPPTLKQ